jgi:23S rRNA pseudouridine1911/1915/1917 synthase
LPTTFKRYNTIVTQPTIYPFTPDTAEIGQRLDKILTDRLAASLNLSRVRVQILIKEGFVQVNGKPGKASYRLEAGDTVLTTLAEAIVAPPDANSSVQAQPIPLSILYDDPQVVAIDKPAGMVVHPAAGHSDNTLVNAVLALYPQVAQVGGERRAGIVHRLDKDTSGVILIAKTEPARLALMRQFAERTVQKRYLALVEGAPDTITGEINAPLGRDPNLRKKIAVIPSSRGGREAITFFKILARYEEFSLLELLPKTGRTHQIRVHLAFIGHPIVGDAIYGRRKQKIRLGRHFLHAESLTFVTPSTSAQVQVQAALPKPLQDVLDRLALA